MFQLKEYQQKTLDELEEYLKQARLFGAKIAFAKLTNNKSEYKAIKISEEILHNIVFYAILSYY
ncbi:MAG: hypothetical protein LUH05_03595 [Candidatus Gastranaerophilales bacterium]|nr:hypothetical protein [Candidatus Gastranaerophilales bacterium]